MSQSKNIVFYGQQIYEEYPVAAHWERLNTFPDGCYLRNHLGFWYIHIGGGFTPINYSDIPPEVRVNCLLMGISV